MLLPDKRLRQVASSDTGLAEEKQVLAMDQPLSTRPGKPALYRVADSNLRLYLAVLQVVQEQARRQPQARFRLLERRWSAWRGKAVETR